MSFANSREEKEITLKNGKGTEFKFILIQYDAFKGIQYQRQLIKILQPSFSALIAAANDKEQNANLEVLAIEKFMENIDQVDPKFLKELVLQGAWREGRVSLNFENDFAGNYGVLFSLIIELVMFNFSDLFQLLGSGQQ